MWHLEDNDPMGCGIDCMDDGGLEDIFGDIIGTVGKIAAAPLNAVASMLPKPARKPVKAAAAAAMPHLAMDPSVRGSLMAQLTGGKVHGNIGGGGTVWAKPGQPGGGPSPAVGIARANAARDIAKIAACNRPRLRAKSTGKTQPLANKELMAKLVADAVAKRVDPRLKAINAKLALAENQRLATSEHNAINNVTAFRRKVLADLMRISSCLPESHPTRQKIRRVGLMSGLL